MLTHPASIAGDFVWRQRIEVRYKDRQESFQAVIEKRGSRLLLLGLTPFGTRAFSLEQMNDEQVVYTPYVSFELPFSPIYVLADVHRTFFRGLTSPQADGTTHGVLDGENVTEQWASGRLLARTYDSAADAREPVHIAIRYSEGMLGSRPPRVITFVNAQHGYTLTITTLLAQAL